MRVAVIDVGSNSIRLLVAVRVPAGLETVDRAREYLGLGADIERLGRVPEARILAAAECVHAYAARARELGVAGLAVLVTAPGRQSGNADRLVVELAAAASAPVQVLTAEEEGRLAFAGAVADLEREEDRQVAVCDVGGGSTEIAIGTVAGGAGWVRSLDVGALRLADRRIERDPPGRKALAAARADAVGLLARVEAPPVAHGLATGGTARALGRIVGPSFGPDELRAAGRKLARRSSVELVRRYRVSPERARTLAAGAAILTAVAEHLDVPLEVARGGLREGAALALVERAASAA